MKNLDIIPQGYITRTYKGRFSARAKKYHQYIEDLRWLSKKHNVIITDWIPEITFVLPMPKSWSKKKKEAMDGREHHQKPDLSNLIKAFEDSLLPGTDQVIWRYEGAMKVWGKTGKIIINV